MKPGSSTPSGRACSRNGGVVAEMHWTEIVERQSGDVLIFDLHGQMTLSGEETPRLLLEIRRAVTNGWRKVLLNLTHVCRTLTVPESVRSSAPTRASRGLADG